MLLLTADIEKIRDNSGREMPSSNSVFGVTNPLLVHKISEVEDCPMTIFSGCPTFYFGRKKTK